MRKQAMVDGSRIDRVGDRRGRGRNEAVDDHRNLLLPGRQLTPKHGRDFTATEPGARIDEQVDQRFMVESQRRIDGRRLAAEPWSSTPVRPTQSAPLPP